MVALVLSASASDPTMRTAPGREHAAMWVGKESVHGSSLLSDCRHSHGSVEAQRAAGDDSQQSSTIPAELDELRRQLATERRHREAVLESMSVLIDTLGKRIEMLQPSLTPPSLDSGVDDASLGTRYEVEAFIKEQVQVAVVEFLPRVEQKLQDTLASRLEALLPPTRAAGHLRPAGGKRDPAAEDVDALDTCKEAVRGMQNSIKATAEVVRSWRGVNDATAPCSTPPNGNSEDESLQQHASPTTPPVLLQRACEGARGATAQADDAKARNQKMDSFQRRMDVIEEKQAVLTSLFCISGKLTDLAAASLAPSSGQEGHSSLRDKMSAKREQLELWRSAMQVRFGSPVKHKHASRSGSGGGAASPPRARLASPGKGAKEATVACLQRPSSLSSSSTSQEAACERPSEGSQLGQQTAATVAIAKATAETEAKSVVLLGRLVPADREATKGGGPVTSVMAGAEKLAATTEQEFFAPTPSQPPQTLRTLQSADEDSRVPDWARERLPSKDSRVVTPVATV
eukprot:TRINITY_DN26477_c0_g1_i1.p1 TRINITY_DN26477_c0_g1~~TRINITY_DN26477_c0_g1_i1.p1  ORF type:complete len:516 (-),score=141.77 TRINITY_DN26477_c0_g1_i1:252-1799(-)